MSTPSRRIAIVLRGPPSVGKSAIRDRILEHVGTRASRFINLDAYWAPGEWRYAERDFRYADLKVAQEPVIVMELAWGEPSDLAFSGATTGAQEWIDVLRTEGREIFPFLLQAEWDDLVARLLKRHGNAMQAFNQIGRATFYEDRHPLFRYPNIPGFIETEIMTSGRTEEQVAEQILRHVRLIP